ncbi:acyl-CoA thioesterase [Candidatus Poriferisocius sp.]|uniref:acyl-CoA thioesterase n=1 Tax=Candidatus Poriferisocius sp. TaxID=3101276 RepID=UPI003B01B468
MSGELPDILELTEVGEQRYHVFQPAESAEGRDVVFSGQLLAQMMMASDREAGGAKDIRSVHAIFARAGTYTLPIEVDVDSMQAGRTWASDSVTATQGGKLLSRALILMSTVDDDLMRHEPVMPDVPAPDGLDPGFAFIFPGAEWRPVPGEPEIDGVPVERAWHRYGPEVESQAANQGIAGWATCGNIIGLAMRPHRDTIRIEDAHRTLSTGVIAHTLHFLDHLDVSQWLLVQMQATKAANGRVYGQGEVFTADGQLVATFQQDSMAKAAPAPMNPSRSM